MKTEAMLRIRPYNGQSHTDYGDRGKQLVEGLTMRDICDCYVRGFIMASNHVVPDELYDEAKQGERARLSPNDLFGFNLDKVDPVAIMQNMTCEIERMMGIYPNIPRLQFKRLQDTKKLKARGKN